MHSFLPSAETGDCMGDLVPGHLSRSVARVRLSFGKVVRMALSFLQSPRVGGLGIVKLVGGFAKDYSLIETRA